MNVFFTASWGYFHILYSHLWTPYEDNGEKEWDSRDKFAVENNILTHTPGPDGMTTFPVLRPSQRSHREMCSDFSTLISGWSWCDSWKWRRPWIYLQSWFSFVCTLCNLGSFSCEHYLTHPKALNSSTPMHCTETKRNRLEGSQLHNILEELFH